MNNNNMPHFDIIKKFVSYLNKKSEDFILKGGTSLLLCYGLDRFSEDIDLDGFAKNINSIIKNFCKEKDFFFRIAKDTDTVKRFFVNYGIPNRPLKIEVSYRKEEKDLSEISVVNNIETYNIDTLCLQKAAAYAGRDKIRDLYDLSFISNKYFDSLNSSTISIIREVVAYKGIEQFDYITKTQSDELINSNKLADTFLKMLDKLKLYQGKIKKTLL